MEDLVIQIRDHYVAQFREFVAGQRQSCITGGPEVRFGLPADTPAYQRTVIVDFVRNDEEIESLLFEPETCLSFDRVEGQIGHCELVIESLRWDRVVIRHDVSAIENAIADWFNGWLDPDDARFDPQAELSHCIHAVYLAPNELQVDLGTAPPEAFWALLVSLADAKATFVRISS